MERRDRDLIDREIDRLSRYAYSTAADREWVDGLRERAERAAEATRGRRLAEAQRLAELLAETRAQRQAQPAPRADRGAAPRPDGGTAPSAGLGMEV